MTGCNSTIHHGNGKQAVENASTCEMSDNQVPLDQDEEDSKVAPGVFNTDLANDEQCETKDVVTPTEPKSNGRNYDVQCATSRPVIERAMSDGSMVIEMQVDMTTQKPIMSGYNSTIHNGNGKKAVESCEMSDNQVPVDHGSDEDDRKVAPIVFNTDLANEEYREAKDVVTPTEPKSNGRSYEFQYTTLKFWSE
jgi:hypothetical protein